MLEVRNLTKTYGPKTAVNDISFTVPNGRVAGFLGPNGAGKSTTMRMLVGLEKPSKGSALVDGQPYRSLKSPLTSVGALLDAKAMHPGRNGAAHLRSLALTHGIPKSRVDEVIEMTGLAAVSKKKVKGFSLGMGQRMGIAAALLGDPQNVILDEPVNGLDPEGVIWVRNLARHLASEGRAVLISSHLMSEMSQTADDLIVIGRGRLLANCSMEDFLKIGDENKVLVRTDARDTFATALNEAGHTFTALETDGLMVEQADARDLARLAQGAGVLLHELTPQKSTLEQVYMNMTRDEVEYHSAEFTPSTGQENAAAPVLAGPADGPAAPWNQTSTDAKEN
ncbi:ABC transporter ATP-binding protein [Rothia nasimurium]|uniref:ABC transporter ATP-binding protein n=1 Tax=Rothia nasimurium TaxID=85336 RepID=UPI001F346487|nr:ABC transporter ATP-binding protein [Rothia nasimurium]